MKTISKTLLFLALLGPFYLTEPLCYAQEESSYKDQSFDYTPGAGELKQKPEGKQIDLDYGDADIINDPVQGTLILPKNRWKSWVARAISIVLIEATLFIIILSLPTNEELSLKTLYLLSGASYGMSFWIFLCGVHLLRLRSFTWIYIIPLAAAMAVIATVIFKRIKRADVSLDDLKESFRKMRPTVTEDKRLASVDGYTGDWPDQDFIQ